MSPSEFDLRAALHDGEGDDDLNVEHLILRGRARAAQRRVRMLSTAAVVAVVAGAGVTGALIAGGGGNRNTASNAGDSRAAGGDLGAGGGVVFGTAENGRVTASPKAAPSAIQPVGADASATVECPSTPPVYAPLAPGSTRAAEPLFSGSVRSVVVCAYGSSMRSISQAAPAPARLDLHGRKATRMVASLENASVSPLHMSCPYSGATTRLAIIGVAGDGSNLGTVTATLSDAACDVQVSNGTSVRYGWRPPREVSDMLAALTPVGLPGSIEPTPTK